MLLRMFRTLDLYLLCLVVLLSGLGMLVLFSAEPGKIWLGLRNLLIAFLIMWGLLQVSVSWLLRIAVPVYVVCLLLLIGVEFFGEVSKGAQRWLDLGLLRVQPSEVMKIAMPMMLAWLFHRFGPALRWVHFLGALLLLLLPVSLVLRQPDLGTAILILVAGFVVIFFAGISWKFVVLLSLIAVLSAPFLCHRPLSGLWDSTLLRSYQCKRIATLWDPVSDPLGSGYHIIQSTIAIGSGGLEGKGWRQGTQTQLDFIPERHTDFIFSVFAEEFGFMGGLLLLLLYFLLVSRSLLIAARATQPFSRLLAASISVILFTYVFVNIGMVMGILPVVGVPLPFLSYGGTSMVTLFVSIGLLMSIQNGRQGAVS